MQRRFYDNQIMKNICTFFLTAIFFAIGLFTNVEVYAATDQPYPASANPNAEEYAQYPKINYGSGAKAAQLKRGEYLVRMGDCIACHSVKESKPFAGGLAFDTPFGTLYSPNITPDKTNGIGSWTTEQFNTAVREGIRPDGQYLFPAFPFPYYNKLSDAELADIRAYLNAVPAVNKKTLIIK